MRASQFGTRRKRIHRARIQAVPNNARAHHFVPQLLLRGFASRTTGSGGKRQYFAWHYMKGQEPHEANIKGVGQSHDFHGSPRDSSLEEQIARLEDGFGKLVFGLRGARALDVNKVPALVRFVAHLMIRTRNLRDGIAAVFPTMFDGFEQFFTKPEAGPEYLERCGPMIEAGILKEPAFQALVESGFPGNVLLRLAMDQLSSAAKGPMLSAVVRQIRGGLDANMIARNNHLEALSAETSILSRTRILERLTWALFAYPEHSFILGDGVALARRVGEPFTLPLLVQPDFYEVAVPIAHDLLIVGSANAPVQPKPALINEASAATSRSWFVACQRTPSADRLHREVLGTRSSFVNESDVEAFIRAGVCPHPTEPE